MVVRTGLLYSLDLGQAHCQAQEDILGASILGTWLGWVAVCPVNQSISHVPQFAEEGVGQ